MAMWLRSFTFHPCSFQSIPTVSLSSRRGPSPRIQRADTLSHHNNQPTVPTFHLVMNRRRQGKSKQAICLRKYQKEEKKLTQSEGQPKSSWLILYSTNMDFTVLHTENKQLMKELNYIQEQYGKDTVQICKRDRLFVRILFTKCCT